MATDKEFDKYRTRGSIHWRELESRDPRVFNAYAQARYEWILKIAGDVRGKSVLDLGCGDGVLTYLLTKKGAAVTGVDNNELGLQYARLRVPEAEFMNASVETLPFEDNSFDLVVSCEVIEHLSEPEKMIQEAKRVLKPGSLFILTTPYKLSETPADPHHVREYFPAEIEKLLKKFFKEPKVLLTHHMFWRGIYAYSFRTLGNKAIGKWLMNSIILSTGWNPFMIDYTESPAKFDLFANICAWGIAHKT